MMSVSQSQMTAFCRSEAVDSSGNSGLHYAAGYGRRELLEYLLKVGFRGDGFEGGLGFRVYGADWQRLGSKKGLWCKDLASPQA